jgi:formate-dependent nitrite reductase membrane component NrfD
VSGVVGPREKGLGRDGRRRAGEVPVVGETSFVSYYGQPVLKAPTWKAPNIAGYLFLGGLAGASSVVAAGAHATGRPGLAGASKVGSTVAIGLSGAALVHDLGRPGRFFNMLRVFKPTSPMSVGSWLLAAYAPASAAASFSAVTGRLPAGGVAATGMAAALGPAVATYTAALIGDTAVPAWHDAYRYLPFVFAASAASAAAGLGLVAAPVPETGPVRLLGIGAAAGELALMRIMPRRMGLPGRAYVESQKGRRYHRAAEAVTIAGIALGARYGRRSRAAAAASGVALLVGSALTRFAIFEAGLSSAADPKYTIIAQRERRPAGGPPSG